MLLLGLDFETQDDKPLTTNITEVGASLWQLGHAGTLDELGKGFNLGTQILHKIEGFSELCYEPEYPPQTEKIIGITGITDEMLKTSGRSRELVFHERLLPLMEKADYVLAHKTSFDQTIFEATCQKFGIWYPPKEWICTLTDWPWDDKYTCRKLSHLAYEHSILVDPATLHRAENDVDLMMQLVAKYDFNKVLEYVKEPWVYFKAKDIKGPWIDGGVQNELVKSLGFSWEQVKGMTHEKLPKTWVTRIKQSKADWLLDTISKSVAPFRVTKIEGLS